MICIRPNNDTLQYCQKTIIKTTDFTHTEQKLGKYFQCKFSYAIILMQHFETKRKNCKTDDYAF